MNKNGNYKFTEEELEEVTKIVSKKSIDEAQRKFGFCGDQFLNLRKTDARLDEAIKKGQEIRYILQNHKLYKELDRFSSFKIKEIAAQRSGIKVIQFKYKTSKRMLEQLRQMLPKITRAVHDGVVGDKRRIGYIEQSYKLLRKRLSVKQSKKERSIK